LRPASAAGAVTLLSFPTTSEWLEWPSMATIFMSPGIFEA
jgi:hypothetical protein